MSEQGHHGVKSLRPSVKILGKVGRPKHGRTDVHVRDGKPWGFSKRYLKEVKHFKRTNMIPKRLSTAGLKGKDKQRMKTKRRTFRGRMKHFK